MSCIRPEDMKALKASFLGAGGVNGFRKMKPEARVQFFYDFLTKNMGELSQKSKDAYLADAETYASRVENQMLIESQREAVRKYAKKPGKPWAGIGSPTGANKDLLQLITGYKDILSLDDKNFMELLVRKKLGFSLDSESAANLMKVANTANKALKDFKANTKDLKEYNDKEPASPEALDLGIKLLEFKDCYDALKLEGIKNRSNRFMRLFYGVTGAMKSIKAAYDVSFGRQLSTAFLAGPQSTLASWKIGMKAFWDGLFNPEKNRAMKALLFVRKNALNGNYARFGLDIGITEEAFPTSTIQNIPVVGRGFKASDESYSLALQYARANLFDSVLENATKSMKGDEAAALRLLEQTQFGGYINSVTGRGMVPWEKSEIEKFANFALFSPRWLWSRVERITDAKYLPLLFGKHNEYDANVMRAKTFIKLVLFNVVFSALARALFVDDEDRDWAEWYDPRSSSFMQARFGDFVVDQTFGVASFFTMLERARSGTTRTNEGVIKKQDPGKTILRFLTGKSSPMVGAILNANDLINYWTGTSKNPPKTFMGDEWTLDAFLKEMFLPISVSNALETPEGTALLQAVGFEEAKADTTWGTVILDVFGVGSREMQDRKKEGMSKRAQKAMAQNAKALGSSSRSNQLAKNSALMTKLTGREREEAQRRFTQQFNRKIDSLVSSYAYKRMTPKEQRDAINGISKEIQKNLRKDYGI